MKKNWTLRVGVLMLALTLITSCFVGGTFAKYVTSGSGTDTARVAKFGVTVTGTGSAFSTTYAKDGATLLLEANTVVSSNVYKLVAPGTKGNMAAFAITGTPEVAVRVAFTATTVDFGDKWVDEDGYYYCPMEITIGETTYKGLDYTTIEEFETAVKDAVVALTKDYAANTNLSTIGAGDPAISWEWKFEGNEDVKDTFLGDQAAAGNAAGIEIGITATVTQID